MVNMEINHPYDLGEFTGIYKGVSACKRKYMFLILVNIPNKDCETAYFQRKIING